MRAKSTGLAAQKKSREQLVTSFESERADFEALVREGYAERQRVREMERNLSQSEGQRGALLSDLAATELQVSETQVKIVQLGKELQREVAKELAEVQAELSALREKLRSMQDTVERTVVRAPDAGMVLGLDVHTLGAVVKPGARAARHRAAEREAGRRGAAVAATTSTRCASASRPRCASRRSSSATCRASKGG